MTNPGREPRRRPTPGPSVTPIIVSFGTLLVALVLLVVHIASASGVASQPVAAPSQPLAVQSASLTQNGQQLVWQLKMAQPFPPARSRVTGARCAC